MSCFCVPGGSIGEAHAIVMQLHMIVIRINGSNTGDSTVMIASRRGKWCGRRQPSDVEW